MWASARVPNNHYIQCHSQPASFPCIEYILVRKIIHCVMLQLISELVSPEQWPLRLVDSFPLKFSSHSPVLVLFLLEPPHTTSLLSQSASFPHRPLSDSLLRHQMTGAGHSWVLDLGQEILRCRCFFVAALSSRFFNNFWGNPFTSDGIVNPQFLCRGVVLAVSLSRRCPRGRCSLSTTTYITQG